MRKKMGYIQVLTTVAKQSDAERIARILVGQELSACVQIIGPITGVYRWKGKIEKSKEWICVVKMRIGQYRNAEKVIKEIHPYQIPEIIALPIVAGSREYLNWLEKESKYLFTDSRESVNKNSL